MISSLAVKAIYGLWTNLWIPDLNRLSKELYLMKALVQLFGLQRKELIYGLPEKDLTWYVATENLPQHNHKFRWMEYNRQQLIVASLLRCDHLVHYNLDSRHLVGDMFHLVHLLCLAGWLDLSHHLVCPHRYMR